MPTRSVVQIARTLPWQVQGGMEAHAWQLSQAWRRRGWDVDVLTTSFEDREYTEERDGVRIHYLRHLPRNRDDLPMWRWWGRFAARVRDYAVAHKIDAQVVHSESAYGTPLFGRLRRTSPATARVLTIHGTTLQVYNESGRARLLQTVPAYHPRALGQWLDVRVRVAQERLRDLPRAGRIVAVSDALRDHLVKDYRLDAARIDVIPNGVASPHRPADRDALRARLGLPSDARTLLYLGRVDASKGIDRIFPHIAAHSRDRLVVAGDGPDLHRLRGLAARLPNPASVRFLGAVPEDVKLRLLAAADVVVLPSEAEGQPLVLLEALAAGTPAYATRPWVPDDLKPLLATGADVTQGIEDAIARTDLVRAKKDDVWRDHSWDRVAQRYEVVFERAVV
jgi:glycosyltransferase involved in cell wall biosynthesis